jgi:cob(I)alamin adenosyltransferase
MKGYVQVYTGEGKGKTTAAFGLALRAAGAGLKVFIAQFIKGMEYSELKAIKRFSDLVEVRQYGRGCFIFGKPDPEDVEAAQKGFEELKRIVSSGHYPMIILDEANIATYYKLLSVDNLMELIRLRPEHVELVITGRYADEKIVDRADLVTEMLEIKHYFNQGIEARVGIEK